MTSDTGVLLEVSHYDAKGRCIYHQDSGQLEASREGMVYATTYRYDLVGNKLEERKAVSEKDGAIQYSLRRWTYDIHSNIIEEKTWLTLQSETSASGLTRTICNTYDKQNRLIRVTDNLDAEVKYTYNSIGRRTSEERKVNAEETQLIKYLYGSNTYEYDTFRRTSKVTTNTGNTQINRYDAEGLRYEMEENGKLVQFIFNENKEVIAEKEDGNITRLIRTSDLWAMESEPEKTWYHYASDEQGSTIFITDRQGKVKNHYAYDAFGNTVAKEEQIQNRYQYTGQQFDQITQQYYLRARFYNPAIARFTQEDEYHGDGLNLYAYCANNPVDYYDPSGYDCELKQLYKKYTPVQYEGTVKVGGVERDVSRKVFQNNEIDWYKKLPNGKTNLELAMSGNAPIGKDGKPIELHHVLQKEPGCMVEIESSIHSNNHQVLHGLIEDGDSFRNDPVLNKQYKNFKRKYWRWRAENVK